MSDYSVEVTTKVWDDKNGCYVSVGPDSDGLDLCMIRYDDHGSQIEIIIPWEMAYLVADAIRDRAPAPKLSMTLAQFARDFAPPPSA